VRPNDKIIEHPTQSGTGSVQEAKNRPAWRLGGGLEIRMRSVFQTPFVIPGAAKNPAGDAKPSWRAQVQLDVRLAFG
jgi:hypothetical protein